MMTYYATLYEADGFGGRSAKLNYGSYANMNLIGIANDSVSSLVVAPFTTVKLYENANFTGRSIAIKGPAEISTLREYAGAFNDLTSSVMVTRATPPDSTILACCTTGTGTCVEYVPGSPTCNAFMERHCANNMGTAACKTWARANTTRADAAVIAYCAANPSDPFCTCVNSPAHVKGIVNPKCVDRKCLESGYLTTNMLAANCPSIVDCSITTQLTNSGVILANSSTIQQNCSGGPTGPTTPGGYTGGTSGGSSTVTPIVTTPIAQDTFSPMLLLLFVLLIALAVLGGVALWRRRRARMATMSAQSPDQSSAQPNQPVA